MKKTIALAIALIMTLTLLIACSGGNSGTQSYIPDGSNNTQNPTPFPQDGNETAAANPTPSAAAGAQITLVNDTGSPFHLRALYLEWGKYKTPNDYDVIENGDAMVLDLNEEILNMDFQIISYLIDGETKSILLDDGLSRSGIPIGSIITVNRDFTYTVELPDGSVATNRVDFSIAKGVDGREVFFRLTVPFMHEYWSGERPFYMLVYLEDSPVLHIHIESGHNERPPFLEAIIFEYARESVMCTYEDNDIIVCINPFEGLDWNAIGEEITVNIQDGTDAFYSFSKHEAEVSLSELLSGVEDICKLNIENLLDNAVLSAKDNGNGTITFTYKDATLTSPIYMAPWDSAYIGGSGMIPFGYGVRFEVSVVAEVYEGSGYWGEFVAWSGFQYPSGLYPEDPWEQRLFNLMNVFSEESFRGSPPGYGVPEEITLDSAVVDEDGLTVTWTQTIRPGCSISDIQSFELTLLYNDSGFWTNHYPADSIWE